ncbi:hypothetical protein FRACYDRAFT_246501 [Fragilariopsis cylindrus CCMP1102]|uniref:HTH psq-type domain-containing protein n=1 Tax=Fragilariopsis cylindrus CCMP1102 TaxID=635003 RepID=A0A1E7EXG3_9STRA|nr:hypothetical protein FRACYDRAFT_246501 [Fragilariopsis cylindrus CCMP1102]|eukprot:OEU10728.1 hypothetical protein FRACYDRAFT_246501 [Fragilariopsis cylindrus CCMP1102]
MRMMAVIPLLYGVQFCSAISPTTLVENRFDDTDNDPEYQKSFEEWLVSNRRWSRNTNTNNLEYDYAQTKTWMRWLAFPIDTVYEIGRSKLLFKKGNSDDEESLKLAISQRTYYDRSNYYKRKINPPRIFEAKKNTASMPTTSRAIVSSDDDNGNVSTTDTNTAATTTTTKNTMPAVDNTSKKMYTDCSNAVTFNSNNKKRSSDDITKASNETTTTTTTTTNANINDDNDVINATNTATATGQATHHSHQSRARLYSNETKIQVTLALETRPHTNTSLNELAREFDIPAGTIRNWRQKRTEGYKKKEQDNSSAAKKIRDNKIAEEDNKTAKMIRDLDERIAEEIAAKEKIRDDKKAETERRRAEEEQKKQDKAKRKVKRKVKRKEYNKKTKLHKDGITLITGNDPEVDAINTFRNKVKDCVKKTGSLSRVFAKDGTDMSSNGFFKFKAYGEAKANSILDESNSIKNCVYRNPDAATSTVQAQAVGEYSADTKQLPHFLAKRVVVAENGTFFGKIKAITDNLKLQKYKDLEAETSHKDNRFRHNLKKPDFDLPDKSFLLARVLEKPAGGDLEWVSKKDKKVFLIPIEKGELLIMMAHAGLCTHKCHDGLYTIVTDFVLPYEAHREMTIHGGLKGKFEKMIGDFATEISHL